MCRSCGAIVGAGESECGVCGAPLVSAAAHDERRARQPIYDSETIRFARAVLTRPAPFTFIFLIANIFLYLLMSFSGGAQGEVLDAYGAKLNALIDAGEWW
ncbi:MAG: hypothetical protein LC672_05885, partial [Acidobacteria bacterium]|nr:hypothetical protein [Acidobacteriota bacterium]